MRYILACLLLCARPLSADPWVMAWVDRCEARFATLPSDTDEQRALRLQGETQNHCIFGPPTLCDFSDDPAACIAVLTTRYVDASAELLATLPDAVPEDPERAITQRANATLGTYKDRLNQPACPYDGTLKAEMVPGTTAAQHVALCEAAFDLALLRAVTRQVQRALNP